MPSMCKTFSASLLSYACEKQENILADILIVGLAFTAAVIIHICKEEAVGFVKVSMLPMFTFL